MAWIEGYDAKLVGERAQRALRFPVGIASPLWALFGAAASGAVAYWWLTRWVRPLNLEANAITAILPSAPESPVLAPANAPVDTENPPEPVAEAVAASPPAEPAPDDLTRMTGIGPKLSLALADRGVTRFAQIAAWTEADLAEFDATLALKGRAVREAWVEQARALATGG